MNPLQRAAAIRKVTYVGAILALFTVSLFWRGTIPLPLRGSPAGIAKPFVWAANHTIQSQATNLEVWELNPEESEAEITGSALRLTLTGSRGVAVTALWLSAIDKQKRNDFHEFEQRVQWVTKLQPNFITPWIFQSWNIAYNVSVEMHGSGDMYFYIVRGIQLLAEGERRNRRSPDMRYQIAFYYQNKFGVSDQVDVLRCLHDLSCIPPAARTPDRFYDEVSGVKRFKYDVFESFCEDYPHLVRRLRGEDQRYTDKRATEKIRRGTPQEVVQFLADNYEVPSRYRVVFRDGKREYTNELADKESQFPALPDQFSESNEAHPKLETKTEMSTAGGYFTAYKAARAWFSYSLLLLPPQMKDRNGVPVAAPTPKAGQFGHDPALHRVPRLPAMVIFRQGAPRAQSYQAEMEQKEGWFDEEGWQVDDPTAELSKLWFADNPDRPTRPKGVVVGAGRAWSREEWQRAFDLWEKHGREYGLSYPENRMAQLRKTLGSDPSSVPAELTQDQYNDETLREQFVAKTGIEYFESNRQVTNFPYFLAAATAEKEPGTVLARKTLFKAELARKIGNPPLAIRLYKDGLEQWKEVLRKNKSFHHPERSDRTEEETCEFELAYQRLLVQDDERVREYADRLVSGSQAVVPFLSVPFPQQDAWYQAQLKQRRQQWDAEMKRWTERQKNRKARDPPERQPEEPRVEPDPLWPSGNREELKWFVVENVAGQSFSSPFVGSLAPEGGPWISDSMKEQVRQKQGVSRKQAPSPGVPTPPGEQPPQPQLP